MEAPGRGGDAVVGRSGRKLLERAGVKGPRRPVVPQSCPEQDFAGSKHSLGLHAPPHLHPSQP
eukprot:8209747-Lingulodinium_polyedra.AAC.1